MTCSKCGHKQLAISVRDGETLLCVKCFARGKGNPYALVDIMANDPTLEVRDFCDVCGRYGTVDPLECVCAACKLAGVAKEKP